MTLLLQERLAIKETGRKTGGDPDEAKEILEEEFNYSFARSTIIKYFKKYDIPINVKKRDKEVAESIKTQRMTFNDEQLEEMRKDYGLYGPNPVRAYLKGGRFTANQYEAGWIKLGLKPAMLTSEDVRKEGRKARPGAFGADPDRVQSIPSYLTQPF